jgi:hypothetical protein
MTTETHMALQVVLSEVRASQRERQAERVIAHLVELGASGTAFDSFASSESGNTGPAFAFESDDEPTLSYLLGGL